MKNYKYIKDMNTQIMDFLGIDYENIPITEMQITLSAEQPPEVKIIRLATHGTLATDSEPISETYELKIKNGNEENA